MRHGKKYNHLSRKSAHRKSMLSNMACSLIRHKRIKTTLAKAKALRVYIEPLLTKSKNDTTHSRRVVFSYLKQKDIITELFGDVSVKIADRPGGYTRILKLSNRLGDNAQLALIELVDYNEEYVTDKPKRKKSRRIRKKSSTIINTEDSTAADITEEAPEEEAKVEEAPKEEAKVEEAPKEEAKVEEAPEEEAKVEEAPAEEAKVEEAKVEEAPKEEAPAEEAPKEEASAEEAPTEEAPEDDEQEIKSSNNKKE